MWRGPDALRPVSRVQRLLRLESLLLPELRLELLLERPLLLLLPPRGDPSSRLPPRWRLLSDWLREDPPLPRDELPDPDDLFDWFAMALLLRGLTCAGRRIRFGSARADLFRAGMPIE